MSRLPDANVWRTSRQTGRIQTDSGPQLIADCAIADFFDRFEVNLERALQERIGKETKKKIKMPNLNIGIGSSTFLSKIRLPSWNFLLMGSSLASFLLMG